MPDNGRYHGELIVKLLDDGRRVELVGPFGYTDPALVAWEVPKGALVDGASIPRPLWSLIGGPFDGKYRSASVIHDWYCDLRTRPWKQTHRVFYHAMRTSGVDEVQAKVMYAGVYVGGPRWSETVVANTGLGRPKRKPRFGFDGLPVDGAEPAAAAPYKLAVPEPLFDRLEEEVRARNPSLSDIERIADTLAPDPR